MPRHLTRTFHSLSTAVLFVAILGPLACLAQGPNTGQASAESSVVFAAPRSIPLVQTPQHPQMAGAVSAQRVPPKPGSAQQQHGADSQGSENPFFLPEVQYDSGACGPITVVVDVNHDGKLDLVTANCNSVGVMLGNGDGTFQAAVEFGSGGIQADGLAVADLNGDGNPDVVISNKCATGTNCQAGPVSVLLGNGDGTFQPAVPYSSAASPYFVAIADLNGDGKPDLVVTSGTSVAVRLGNGDGTFQPSVNYDTNEELTNYIVVADVNGDGKPDLVVAAGLVFVFLGNGDGTFQSPVGYSPGGGSLNSLAVADVNGDGKLDILAGAPCEDSGECYDDSTVGVLLGNGDGTFQPVVTYDSGGRFSGTLAVADLNGDGKLDVVTANGANPYTVGLLLGNGDGTFQPAQTFSVANGPLGVAVADLNGDALPDVVVNEGAFAGILINNSGPHTPTTTTLASSLNPALVRAKVTYTATVTGQPGTSVTGSVTFLDGGSWIGTATVSGNQAAFTTSYNAIGLHSITASYSGDLHNSVSTSAPLTEAIEDASSTKLSTSGSPSFVGQPVTFTATVTSKYGTIPDGELVTFYDGSAVIGTGNTASGVATSTTSSLTAKTHRIKATYAGDTTFESSSGTATQVVDKYPTTTALVSSLNPSTDGQAVTFTATVTSSGPQTPTGKVQFKDGTASIGSATLNAGAATLTKSTLTAGSHSITAKYEADSDSASSTSSILDQVVNP